MRAIILLSFCLLISFTSAAQKKALTLIEKEKFSKAHKLIKKKYKKDPGDVLVNLAIAKLFNARGYKRYNTDTAYTYIKKVGLIYYAMDEKAQRKVDHSINKGVITYTMGSICENSFEDTKMLHTIEAYNYFMAYYLGAGQLLQQAELRRDTIAFVYAMAINTVESYQSFINTYPFAIQINEAKKIRNALAYKQTLAVNTIEAFQEFIDTYKKADERSKAIVKRDELLFREAEKVNNSRAYLDFIRNHLTSHLVEQANDRYEVLLFSETTIPGNVSSYINFIKAHDHFEKGRKLAEDSLLAYAYMNKDLAGMRFYYDNGRFTAQSDSLNLQLLEVFTFDGDASSINEFEEVYPYLFGFEATEEMFDIAIEGAELYSDYLEALWDDKPVSHFNSKFEEYIKKSAPKQSAFFALQLLLKRDIDRKAYISALTNLKKFDGYFPQNDPRITSLKEILSAKVDPKIQVKSIGSKVNTEAGEYVPIISADNKMLYFCGRNRKNNIGGEDIFQYNLITKSSPELISELSSSFSNDAPLSVSTDGTQLLVFIDGDIYYSNKNEYGWDVSREVPGNVNSSAWEADAMISSDGNVLIFTSDRPGGVGFYHERYKSYCWSSEGNVDMYISLKQADGDWGIPLNLGSTINTPFCDRSPFLHPDMKTLYFSSNGHGGLGDLDVYRTTRLSDTSWAYWSKPVNMGKEINSADTDWGYKISTDGTKAYFSKRSKKGDHNIYYINVPPHLRPDYVATIAGKLLDKDKKPISAKIKWEDLETGKNVGESKSDPVDGSYFIVLPLGKIYGYYVVGSEYFPISNSIDLREVDKPVELEKNIDIVTFKEMIEEGIAVPVNNLFFDYDKYDLLSTSIPELKRIAEIITERSLNVEIAGHTDSTGTIEYNQNLSELRATEVKKFLVKVGVNESLLNTVGYGAMKPVDTNQTEKGRALNRRVELRFIK